MLDERTEDNVVDDEASAGRVRAFEAMPLRDDNPSQIDLLGFGDIVAAVESTITREDLDPITVGVNAPWGGGKTTVLQLLHKQLAARDDVLVVYVSPWEYDRTTDRSTSTLSGGRSGRTSGRSQRQRRPPTCFPGHSNEPCSPPS